MIVLCIFLINVALGDFHLPILPYPPMNADPCQTMPFPGKDCPIALCYGETEATPSYDLTWWQTPDNCKISVFSQSDPTLVLSFSSAIYPWLNVYNNQEAKIGGDSFPCKSLTYGVNMVVVD